MTTFYNKQYKERIYNLSCNSVSSSSVQTRVEDGRGRICKYGCQNDSIPRLFSNMMKNESICNNHTPPPQKKDIPKTIFQEERGGIIL